MTTIDARPAAAARLPARVGQATAVEQSRAVAEVEAAVIVAQRMPRDLSRAQADMQRSCAQEALAQRAFFRYGRGGQQVTGPTVHLARELARCFGNVQYGIAELRRDDDYGQSEMPAFAWDVQTNTRASTTFIVPHRRDKTGGAVALTDMRDIYENNANMGARRLREQIFAILPGWYTEAAIAACYETLNGNDSDLPVRIARCVDGYAASGVTQQRLEAKLGAPRSAWTAADLAQLQVIWRSIGRGETTRAEEFGDDAGKVTKDEVMARGEQPAAEDVPGPDSAVPPVADGQPAAPPAGEPSGPGTSTTPGPKFRDLLANLPLGDAADVAVMLSWLAGRAVTAPSDLSRAEQRMIAGQLDDWLRAADGDFGEAASAAWARYHEQNPEAGDG